LAVGPTFYLFMRILLVKTSSLGDVIHNLPVVSDLQRSIPDCHIDWCVEEGFAEIPRLHPGVSRIIPVALRRWRKRLGSRQTWSEIAELRRQLGQTPYDLVVDTQGLLKSALLCTQARGIRHGYDRNSIREPLASRFYQIHHHVSRQLHAVQRNRELAALACGYAARLADLPLNYGITAPPSPTAGNTAVLLTATSRDDKLWNEDRWVSLTQRLIEQGIAPQLPSGSPVERARAERIAAQAPGATPLPPSDLATLAANIGSAQLVVGVDTGLTHLATALGRPTIALYTATDPGLTGVYGPAPHINLGGRNAPPSLDEVWAQCQAYLARDGA